MNLHHVFPRLAIGVLASLLVAAGPPLWAQSFPTSEDRWGGPEAHEIEGRDGPERDRRDGEPGDRGDGEPVWSRASRVSAWKKRT